MRKFLAMAVVFCMLVTMLPMACLSGLAEEASGKRAATEQVRSNAANDVEVNPVSNDEDDDDDWDSDDDYDSDDDWGSDDDDSSSDDDWDSDDEDSGSDDEWDSDDEDSDDDWDSDDEDSGSDDEWDSDDDGDEDADDGDEDEDADDGDEDADDGDEDEDADDGDEDSDDGDEDEDADDGDEDEDSADEDEDDADEDEDDDDDDDDDRHRSRSKVTQTSVPRVSQSTKDALLGSWRMIEARRGEKVEMYAIDFSIVSIDAKGNAEINWGKNTKTTGQWNESQKVLKMDEGRIYVYADGVLAGASDFVSGIAFKEGQAALSPDNGIIGTWRMTEYRQDAKKNIRQFDVVIRSIDEKGNVDLDWNGKTVKGKWSAKRQTLTVNKQIFVLQNDVLGGGNESGSGVAVRKK